MTRFLSSSTSLSNVTGRWLKFTLPFVLSLFLILAVINANAAVRQPAVDSINTELQAVAAQNQEDFPLSTANPWTSADSDTTLSIAWGDVDGDGDLDLAAGNSYNNKVYLNVDGTLQSTAVWQSEDGGASSVAWGDMDGDGDLDLAVGTHSGANRIYLNENGVLNPTAEWLSNDSDRTRSVAWGDVNGDGYLDLAVGNEAYDWNCHCYVGRVNKLYLNEGGVLQTTAAWTSGDSSRTMSVAWGDVDGDGDLDLAAGNEASANKVYLNVNGELAPTAAWSSNDEDHTSSVAWGDVDGDGDFDLAVGNKRHEENKVYFNQNGTLESTASWASGSDTTYSVAWGDVDGDGDLDLAAGNIIANIVYLNEGGALQFGWSSNDGKQTNSVAWGDVDGDGDLDLAAGNGGNNKIYQNQFGVMETDGESLWPDDNEGTRSIAWEISMAMEILTLLLAMSHSLILAVVVTYPKESTGFT